MSLFDKIEKRRKESLSLSKKFERPRKRVEKVKNKKVTENERNRISVENHLRESTYPQLDITSIVYQPTRKEDLEKMAVCEITNLNKSQDLTNTVDDPRLGTIENNRLCATCRKTNQEDPGHLGILRLPAKLIHPFFRLTAMRVLQCVCNTCYGLLMSEKYIMETGICQSSGYNRLIRIAEESKDGKIPCSRGCTTKNPIFKPQKSGSNEKVNMFCVRKINRREVGTELTVDTIYKILSSVSDKDVKLMGFQNTHPKDFIVDFVTVIPLSARPWNLSDGQMRDDYITSTYCEILSKKIEYYQESNDDDTLEIDRKEECMNRILYLMDHSIQNCDQTHRRTPTEPCKSFTNKISGKDALVRNNIMGKRVDYSGRTVLGPNRSISFGEIALPVAMQSVLTVPERVTIYNMDNIKVLSSTERIDYLCPKRGPFAGRKLKYDPKKHTINIGDRVGRFSEEGDVILFNRQPTLHRQSMLGYRVTFQEKMSVGIHLSSTTGHNADFDGDEGNIHMLQTVDAQTEGRMIMASRHAIMSSENSGPVAGLVYNSLIGGFLLSQDGMVLPKKIFAMGIESIRRFTKTQNMENNLRSLFQRAEKYSTLNKYSGKVLVSVLFPEDFHYTHYKDKGDSIEIRNGILRKGVLTKSQMGGSPGSIVQSLWKQYGEDATVNFISNANFLFCWYSEFYGMTLSVRDCIPENIREFEEVREEKISALNDKVTFMDPLPDDATEIEKEERESKIIEKIQKTTEDVKKIFFEEYLERDNSLSLMINSGAKGNETQISYITAFLGQQFINNNQGTFRPLPVSSGGKRWLPTFHIDDKSIYSRGFSGNSFFRGLNPDEYFAQAQASRITLTDTALKTAETGTLQRNMVKAQEGFTVKYDGTVRNHTNIVFQFNYGAGFSASNMVFSTNSFGMRTRSFINLRETVDKENSLSGFPDFNIGSFIVRKFNEINGQYGDEKLIEEEDEYIKLDDLDDYQEALTYQFDEKEIYDVFKDLE